MSLKPKGKHRRFTRKQMLQQRARKGVATKMEKKKIEKLAKTKEILEEGGTAIEVCQTLDCALGDATKLIATVNDIIKRGFGIKTPTRSRPRDVEKGMSLDEIGERVFSRVKELMAGKNIQP